MRLKNPVELAEGVYEDVNTLASWYTDKLLYTSPSVSYSTVGLTFYGLGYSLGRWITGPGIGGRAGAAISMKLWRDLQAGFVFHLVRQPQLPALAATAVVASELQSTLHGNLGMQEIPGSMGGYSHPMGGGDSSYHPFQWFFDLF